MLSFWRRRRVEALRPPPPPLSCPVRLLEACDSLQEHGSQGVHRIRARAQPLGPLVSPRPVLSQGHHVGAQRRDLCECLHEQLLRRSKVAAAATGGG